MQNEHTESSSGSASIRVRDGILVLSGYGIRVSVRHGRLLVTDNPDRARRTSEFARATSGIRRLVVIGHTGFITLDALRWLSDVGAAFAQIDADGRLVASSASGGTNDVARRRAQLAAASSDTGREIVQLLLTMKLRAQAETLARFQPERVDALAEIEAAAKRLTTTDVDEMRWHEAVAASAYWSALAPLPATFPRNERSRLAEHWATIGPRTSPLSGRPRSAATPFHAMLNYLYAILENEARIAIHTVGLDPEVGLLHAERRSRNSFAHDLIEPLRPEVDWFLLDMVGSRTLSVRDFVEARDGHCRLTPNLARMLVHTGPRWSPRLLVLLESVVKMLERNPARPLPGVPGVVSVRGAGIGRLHRRTAARGRSVTQVMPKTVCTLCGGALARGLLYCSNCRGIQQRQSVNAARPAAIAAIAGLRAEGCDPTHGGAVGQLRAQTAAAQEQAVQKSGGRAKDVAGTRAEFDSQIRPALTKLSIRRLSLATGLSPSYWSLIKRGKRVPHRRHWDSLRKMGEQATR